MSSKKRTLLIIASIIGTPVIFYVIGGILSALYPYDGGGWGIGLIWVVLGFLSMFASMVAGPVVSYATKNRSTNPWVPLIGYIGPPVISFLIGIPATISSFAGAS